MSNKAKRQRNKELRKQASNTPRPYSEGYFEEMENRDYWDVDALEKVNAPILKKIQYWKEYQPVNWLGKWWVQTQIDKLTKKLKHYEQKESK